MLIAFYIFFNTFTIFWSSQYGTGRDVEAAESGGVAARLSTLFIQAGNDDIRIVDKLVTSHEIQYKSISFGEDVIKEMIMSSVFGIPVSAKVNFVTQTYFGSKF